MRWQKSKNNIVIITYTKEPSVTRFAGGFKFCNINSKNFFYGIYMDMNFSISFFDSKKSAPNFTGRLPKGVFYDIRDIPNLTCARCGKKMMSIPQRNHFVTSVRAGSRAELRNTALDEFRTHDVFKFFSNLSKKHPFTPLEKLVSRKSVKRKMDGLGRVGKLEAKEILEITGGMTKNAPQVMKKLNTIKDQVPKNYQELLFYMDFYAKQYPKNTFSEIFNKPEVWMYHDKIARARKNLFLAQRERAMNKLEELGKSLPDTHHIQKCFDKVKLNTLSLISDRNKPNATKRLELVDIYKRFLGSFNSKSVANKFWQQVNDLPYSTQTADNLLLNMRRCTDTEIVRQIADNMTSTFEHIVPASKGGSVAKHNGLCFCQACNQERATVAYTILLGKYPEFAQNVQKQMNRLVSFITHGKLPTYEEYPKKVKKTLLDVTNQKLRINIKKYLKFVDEKAQNELVKAKALYDNDQKLLSHANSNIAANDAKIEELKRQIQKLQEEKEILDFQKQRYAQKSVISKNIYNEAKLKANRATGDLEKDK